MISSGRILCDTCRPILDLGQTFGPSFPSAKIKGVLELLDRIKTKGDGEEKTLVMSHFPSFLKLIEPFLVNKGIKCVSCELKLNDIVHFPYTLHHPSHRLYDPTPARTSHAFHQLRPPSESNAFVSESWRDRYE